MKETQRAIEQKPTEKKSLSRRARINAAAAILVLTSLGLTAEACKAQEPPVTNNYYNISSPDTSASTTPSTATDTQSVAPSPVTPSVASVQEISQQPEVNSNWPATQEQAASIFGGDPYTGYPGNWQPTGNGGWSLRPDSTNHPVNLSGYFADGSVFIPSPYGQAQEIGQAAFNAPGAWFRGVTMWPITDRAGAVDTWNKIINSHSGAPEQKVGNW